MSARDRMVVVVIAVLALLGAGWLLAVSPKRQQASKLASKVSEAQSQLSSAEGQLASARTAQAQYSAAYASIVSLGKAVPASAEVPSLIYELAQATNEKKVEFSSISTSSKAGAPSAGASTAAAGASSSSSAAAAGFSQLPFTFVFNGSFVDLEHLFHQLNGFALRSTAGSLQVSGRLLTIQGVTLAPLQNSGPSNTTPHPGATQSLSGTITATAYTLPLGTSLTGGATAASPAAATTPVSSSAASSAAPPAAVARVTP